MYHTPFEPPLFTTRFHLALPSVIGGFVGAVSDVEMQEHYDEFFEVSERRVFSSVEGQVLFFMPLWRDNRKVTVRARWIH